MSEIREYIYYKAFYLPKSSQKPKSITTKGEQHNSMDSSFWHTFRQWRIAQLRGPSFYPKVQTKQVKLRLFKLFSFSNTILCRGTNLMCFAFLLDPLWIRIVPAWFHLPSTVRDPWFCVQLCSWIWWNILRQTRLYECLFIWFFTTLNAYSLEGSRKIPQDT